MMVIKDQWAIFLNYINKHIWSKYIQLGNRKVIFSYSIKGLLKERKLGIIFIFFIKAVNRYEYVIYYAK